MSWSGAGSEVAFRSLAASECWDGEFCANVGGEKVTAARWTMTKALKRFSIFEAPRRYFNWNLQLKLIVRTEYAFSKIKTKTYLNKKK
jgi:hypothetical protein